MATETAETVDTTDPATTADAVAPEAELVLDELLVEEISIDGMCGVY